VTLFQHTPLKNSNSTKMLVSSLQTQLMPTVAPALSMM
jgi:hypothetical protein